MMAKCKTRGSKALKHCHKELEMLLEDDETQTLGSKTFSLLSKYKRKFSS